MASIHSNNGATPYQSPPALECRSFEARKSVMSGTVVAEESAKGWWCVAVIERGNYIEYVFQRPAPVFVSVT